MIIRHVLFSLQVYAPKYRCAYPCGEPDEEIQFATISVPYTTLEYHADLLNIRMPIAIVQGERTKSMKFLPRLKRLLAPYTKQFRTEMSEEPREISSVFSRRDSQKL